MGLEAGSQGPVAVVRSSMSRQRHRRSQTTVHWSPGSDFPYQRVSVFARHADVADEEIGTTCFEHTDRVFYRYGSNGLGSGVAHDRLDQLARFGVVLDDQHRDAPEGL